MSDNDGFNNNNNNIELYLNTGFHKMTPFNSVCTVLYSTVLYSTVLYSTVLYSTIQVTYSQM